MVPAVAVHVTALVATPLTVAVNCKVSPARTFADPGVVARSIGWEQPPLVNAIVASRQLPRKRTTAYESFDIGPPVKSLTRYC